MNKYVRTRMLANHCIEKFNFTDEDINRYVDSLITKEFYEDFVKNEGLVNKDEFIAHYQNHEHFKNMCSPDKLGLALIVATRVGMVTGLDSAAILMCLNTIKCMRGDIKNG